MPALENEGLSAQEPGHRQGRQSTRNPIFRSAPTHFGQGTRIVPAPVVSDFSGRPGPGRFLKSLPRVMRDCSWATRFRPGVFPVVDGSFHRGFWTFARQKIDIAQVPSS